jgi:hypothetical protein
LHLRTIQISSRTDAWWQIHGTVILSSFYVFLCKNKLLGGFPGQKSEGQERNEPRLAEHKDSFKWRIAIWGASDQDLHPR